MTSSLEASSGEQTPLTGQSFEEALSLSNRVSYGAGPAISAFDISSFSTEANTLGRRMDESTEYDSELRDPPYLHGKCVYLRSPDEHYIPGRLVNLSKLTHDRALDALDRPFVNLTHPCVNHPLTPQVVPDSLVFESRFESGNLRAAVCISPSEYDLIIDADTNSGGCTQWFFFSIANTTAGSTIKLNIINEGKKGSLFKKGMKPLLFSHRSAYPTKCPHCRGSCLPSTCSTLSYVCPEDPPVSGWTRGVTDVRYTPTGLSKRSVWRAVSCLRLGQQSAPDWEETHASRRKFYTLSFTYTCEHTDDVVFFAYCLPYTVTRLHNFLSAQLSTAAGDMFMRRTILGRSLAGNRLDEVTITDRAIPTASKRYAVVIARTHSGETSGSFAVEGLIKWLLSEEGDMCRKAFIFKIVPMINPDGVVNGNYRCSLAGSDLNRVWESPSQSMHPEVVACRRLLFRLKDEGEIALFVDFHSHSKQLGWFAYGCMPKEGTPRAALVNPHQVMVMPHLFSSLDPKRFILTSCAFGVNPGKEQTARVTVHNKLNIAHCFTLESSAAGIAEFGGIKHFSDTDYESIGAVVGNAMLQRLNHHDAKGIKAKIDSLVRQFINKGTFDEDSDSDQDDLFIVDDIVARCNGTIPRGMSYTKKDRAKPISHQVAPVNPVSAPAQQAKRLPRTALPKWQAKPRPAKQVPVIKKEIHQPLQYSLVAPKEIKFGSL